MNPNKNYLSDLRKGWETQHNNKLIRIKKYKQNPTLCTTCSKSLPYEKRKNRYCSRSCSASQNNRGLNRHTGGPAGAPNKKCPQCKGFYKSTSSKQVCCSRYCAAQYKQNKIYKQMDTTLDLSSWDVKTRKNYLINRQGYECSICEIKEWRGQPAPLIMDHIDGNPYNDRKDNLRLVCAMCDAQLPTYKSKNKGNGRHYRRQRRKEGRSF